MLKMAGGATLGLGLPGKILAVLKDGSIVVQNHQIPAEKGLTEAWKKALVARGEKEVWTGEALESIGMPIGGIATGQLYLRGDGTLGCWEIFNHHEFQSYGSTSYAKRAIPDTVKFGFTCLVGGGGWDLHKEGFGKVSFNGQYPTATVTYEDEGSPVRVRQTAYSPFIPLNAKDSGLPATLFEIEVENTSGTDQKVTMTGFLENAVSRSAGSSRKTWLKAVSGEGMCGIMHGVDPVPGEFFLPDKGRKTVPIADFEGSTYGDWKVEGTAFGPGPARGTLPNQNAVTGFVGKGLVNTYFEGDDTKGKLTSPEFTVERSYINFKIGGGRQPGKCCINLLVDGKVARTSTGLNDEKLMWESWNVSEFEGKKAQIEIVDDAAGGWAHINIDQIEQADTVRSHEDLKARHGDPNLDNGTMALAYLGQGVTTDAARPGPELGRLASAETTVRAGARHTFVFVLAWNFPNHPRGHNYVNFWSDAGEVAQYVAQNAKRLSRDTKLWRDTYYDSTLPYWLLDRLHSTAGNLCTGTTQWWKTGRFWAYEGVVCCSGTCTHVWNYEHSMARLFPELERNVRDRQDFGEAFDEATGLVGFRSDREYAADGQCGTVLKAYREHLGSADDSFLKKHWPRIKKSLEYLIAHDANGDGVIEDAQPNTYDIDFFGANTFVGSLYLAALRAGEEMAKLMGDSAFATQCRGLFENGSEANVKNLFNGEYFIQDVDQNKYKEFQYGPGCLADQLFGQGWAHQVGLGHIYPKDNVVRALQAVWKYNWAPDVAAQNKRWPPERPFAVPGEAGLFICTWPSGGREKEPVRYRDEVWTGIEYQVAGNMIWDGLVEEGLSICRAVHERYHPIKRNPYNEVECSDHYARAMASWGVYTALSGFRYDGPRGSIGFDPRVTPEDFRAAFTAAEGWGTYSQKAGPVTHNSTLKLAHGKLRVTEIVLRPLVGGRARVTLGGKPVQSTTSREEGLTRVSFDALTVNAGDTLEVQFSE